MYYYYANHVDHKSSKVHGAKDRFGLKSGWGQSQAGAKVRLGPK